MEGRSEGGTIMLRTRIYPVTGFHVDVQESVEEVKELMAHSAQRWFIALTLESGETVHFMRDHIVYFTKY